MEHEPFALFRAYGLWLSTGIVFARYALVIQEPSEQPRTIGHEAAQPSRVRAYQPRLQAEAWSERIALAQRACR